jgi:hypothetical protein
MEVLAPSPDYRLERDSRRAPDWRYQRVRELLDLPVEQRRLQREEKYVCEAAKFIRRYEEAPGCSDLQKRAYRQRRVYPADPGLWHAWELFRGIVPGGAPEGDQYREVSVPDDPDRLTLPTLIEACVLARMAPREIGNVCCQLPAAVVWYEQLFYDVRSRLDFSHWVRSELIGNNVLKRYAYEGGPRALEELVSGHDATVTPPPPGQSRKNYWSSQFEAGVTRRCAEAIGGANLSNRDMQLFQLVSSRSSRQAADADDDMRTGYVENMRAFLQNWSILTGREDLRQLALPLPVGRIEPRVSDQIRAAADPEFAAELQAAYKQPLNREKNQD